MPCRVMGHSPGSAPMCSAVHVAASTRLNISMMIIRPPQTGTWRAKVLRFIRDIAIHRHDDVQQFTSVNEVGLAGVVTYKQVAGRAAEPLRRHPSRVAARTAPRQDTMRTPAAWLVPSSSKSLNANEVHHGNHFRFFSVNSFIRIHEPVRFD